MTAHRHKPTITPEWVRWFARYRANHPAWGIFHVCLEDGNWRCGAVVIGEDSPLTAELAAAVDWFDSLTPSQRKRLGDRAERLASEGPA